MAVVGLSASLLACVSILVHGAPPMPLGLGENSLQNELGVDGLTIIEVEAVAPPEAIGEVAGNEGPELTLSLPFSFPELPFPFPGSPQLSPDIHILPDSEMMVSVPFKFPFAPPDYALYKNCHVDRETYCANLPPPYSLQSLFKEPCFVQNAEKLSKPCRDMLGAFHEGPDVFDSHIQRSLRDCCAADKAKLCDGKKIEGGPWQLFTSGCIANNRARLSPACRATLDAFASAHAHDAIPPHYMTTVQIEIIRLPASNVSSDSGVLLSIDEVLEDEEAQGPAPIGDSNLLVDNMFGDTQSNDNLEEGDFGAPAPLGLHKDGADDGANVNVDLRIVQSETAEHSTESQMSTMTRPLQQALIPKPAYQAAAVLLSLTAVSVLLSVLLAVTKSRRERHAVVQRAMAEQTKASLVAKS